MLNIKQTKNKTKRNCIRQRVLQKKKKLNNKPMKFPSIDKFSKWDGRAVHVRQRASWVQQTTICYSLGFYCGLISRIVCRFHKGPLFFSTLQNWFITPLYSKNVPVIKATIAQVRGYLFQQIHFFYCLWNDFFLLSCMVSCTELFCLAVLLFQPALRCQK